MEVPTEIYIASSVTNQSRIYHTRLCTRRMEKFHTFPATEETVDMLRKLGYTPCKTCRLRYEKEQKAAEHELVLAQLDFKAIHLPDEFELRVYWHRDKGNPVEIWSSRNR